MKPKWTTCTSRCGAASNSWGARGISLVEVLVVISIILILLSILLASLRGVQRASRNTQTLATMHAFLASCEAFRLEQGFDPGLIPESILANNNHQISHGVPGVAISGTENALLHLMGGYVVRGTVSDVDWANLTFAGGWIQFDILTPEGPPFTFKLNQGRMGEGPTVNGKVFGCYFHPSPQELQVLDHVSGLAQWPMDSELADSQRLPDLVDGWGNPILYLRQAHVSGPLVGDAHVYNVIKPQFYVDNLWPYTLAPSQLWKDPCQGGDGRGSILYGNHASGEGEPPWQVPKALAQMLRSPVRGEVDPIDPSLPGVALGSIMLISAGADGIYFSAIDGPGSAKRPIGCTGCGGFQAFPYDEFLHDGLPVIRQFDDLRVWGGNPGQ